MPNNMRIISFDPGYERLGVAIVERLNNKDSVIFSCCIQTSAKESHPNRLATIGYSIEKIFEEFSPAAAAIEGLFFTNNQKTALKVSEVRGLLIFLSKKYGCEVYEYTPNQIKVAVTGNGRAVKKDIIAMVPRLISFSEEGRSFGELSKKNPQDKVLDDEYDAIACGITCLATECFPHK